MKIVKNIAIELGKLQRLNSTAALGNLKWSNRYSIRQMSSELSHFTFKNKVKINDASIFYELVSGGQHAVLLLPGALGCTRTDFVKQLQNLDREKFTLVGMDPRGYGHSRPPDKKFSFNFLREDADDAAALMESLGIDSYSILGWSDGANTASILAAKYSDRVNKLVVWGGNSYVTPEELTIYKNIRDINTWSPRMRQPMIDIYGEETFEKLWHAWVDVFLEMPKNEEGIIDLYTKDLTSILCETLIIHGDKDAMVPKFQAEDLLKGIKNSKLVCWEDGKHNLHIKYDARFKELVEDFLLQENN